MSADRNSLEDLVVEYLDRSESEGGGVLEELCAREPDRANELRSRVASLGRMGFLPSASPDRAPERLGEFRILEKIGGGGMGVVHRALQEPLGRVVALKVLRPEQVWFDGARDRFRREAESVARLAHPAIVPLFAFGEADGVPYLAMEYVRGTSLASVVEALRTRDPASLRGSDLVRALAASIPDGPGPRGDIHGLYAGSWSDAVARIGVVVAGALEHAHGRGVLHRDLKPSNVMLAEDGRILLVDFGLAIREGADRLTRAGSQLGSLPYMAPEQVDGRVDDVDARTDVYGLAVTLYEMLALRLPFESSSSHEIVRRVSQGDAAPVRSVNPRVSRDLETVIAKAMDRSVERRYASAAAFARDLQNVVSNRPIEARRTGPIARARRWAQRHPAGAAALVLGTVLLVGGPLGYALQQKRALADLAVEAGRTARANAELEAALARAESNFERALDAVALLTEVGDEELADVPAAEEARRTILEGALQFHGQLAAERRDDPALAIELARTEMRVGEILAALGRNAEAEVVFASVEQVATTVPSARDSVEESFLAPRAAMARARALEALGRRDEAAELFMGVVLRLGEHAMKGGPVEARELLLEAWTRIQESRRSRGDAVGSRDAHVTRSRIGGDLYEEFPEEMRYGVEVAECYLALALQQSKYQVTRALTDLEEDSRVNLLEFADGVIEKLRARGTDHEENAALLARVLTVRAQTLADLKRHDESLVAWSECIEILRERARRHPGVPRHDSALANGLASLAGAQTGATSYAAGLASYEEAIALRERRLALDPGRTQQRAAIGILRWNCALNLRRLGRGEEFLTTSDRALDEVQAHRLVEPDDPYLVNLVENMRYLRALHHLDAGANDSARAELTAVGDVGETNRLLHAMLWARCAAAFTGEDSIACREHALDLLERAVGGPKARKLLDSPEFDGLRGDPRFVAAERRLAP